MARRQPEGQPAPQQRPLVRCAIYTRKSTDENLDNGFNSLDAQREAGENYIRSQQHEGWVALPTRYDDGAYSGATLERPALQSLLADVRTGCVDTIVVYKIDRLSRSLLDFTKLVEELEHSNVSLVAVTQQFNTTTSMGRLTLNILLSFAQFEREVIGERIRDKIAAEKRRGRWLGGRVPLGYTVDKDKHRLVVDEDEAGLVRFIYRRFMQLRSVVELVRELSAGGYRTKMRKTRKGEEIPGRPWDKSAVYRLLKNPVYIGLVRHKENTYPGEHEAIIDRKLWDEVQRTIAQNHVSRGNKTRSQTPAMLRGLLRCGSCGTSMGVTFSKKGERRYRYYLCQRANKNGYDACPVRSVPAGDIEQAVLIQLRRIFQAPEVLAATLRSVEAREAEERDRLTAMKDELDRELAVVKSAAANLLQTRLDSGQAFVGEELGRLDAQRQDLEARLRDVEGQLRFLARNPVTPEGTAEELARLDNIWDNLVPAEQQRIMEILVDQVTVYPERIEVAFAADGLYSIVGEMRQQEEQAEPAPKLGAPPPTLPLVATPGLALSDDGPSIQLRAGRMFIVIPMQFKRRGGRKEIILLRPAGYGGQVVPRGVKNGTPVVAENPAVQKPLAVAVARAHRWQALLDQGRYRSISDLADAAGLDRSYVRRLVNLTLLSPDLVRAILDGSEPSGLSITKLMEGVPERWEEQGTNASQGGSR